MGSLPAGTVTFLFTDVEGSTRLLDSLGEAGYADALATHRKILRAAFTANGGVEVDTQGDAFFVAFPTAPGAIAAATAATDGLSGGPIRIRIGIHSGTPLVTAEGYSTEVGWAIDGVSDEADREQLYQLLENQVVPTWHKREEWLRMMKASIATLAPQFSMQRAVIEYVERYYVPAA